MDQIDEASATLMDMLSSRMYQTIDESSLEGFKTPNVPSPSKEVIDKVK